MWNANKRKRKRSCSFGWHQGGALFGFADGSVRFFSENIDPLILMASGTRSGEEPVDDAGGDYLLPILERQMQ